MSAQGRRRPCARHVCPRCAGARGLRRLGLDGPGPVQPALRRRAADAEALRARAGAGRRDALPGARGPRAAGARGEQGCGYHYKIMSLTLLVSSHVPLDSGHSSAGRSVRTEFHRNRTTLIGPVASAFHEPVAPSEHSRDGVSGLFLSFLRGSSSCFALSMQCMALTCIELFSKSMPTGSQR